MNRFAALLGAVVCCSIAACRSGAIVDSLSVPLVVVGGTTVAVGDTIRLTAAGGYAAGDSVRQPYTWSASDGSVARANTFLLPNNQVLITGLKAGDVTISAKTSTGSGQLHLTVEDRRPVVSTVPGASVSGGLTQGVAANRIAIALSAGDTVDFSVTADGADLTALRIQSMDRSLPLNGALGTTRIALYGAVVAPHTGTYLLDVAADLSCGHGVCRAEGPYTFRSRRSGPIFNMIGGGATLVIPQGAVLTDTTWLQNVGAGVLTVSANGTPGSWLRPDVASLAVAGPSPAATEYSVRPSSAVALTSTVDTRSLAPGTYADTVALDAGDVWGPYWRLVNGAESRPGHAVRYISLRVIDSTMRIVAPTTKLVYITALPDGRLFGATRDGIFTVDPSTGATTPFLAVGAPSRSVSKLVGGLDGQLYFSVVAAGGDSIYRAAGSMPTAILGWPDHYSGAFTVLADGTVYAIHESAFTRLSNGAATPTVAFVPYYNAPVVAYQAAEQAIYFAVSGQLRRYDLARGVVEARGAAGVLGAVLAIDARDRLYASSPSATSLLVLDTQGQVLDRIVPPCLGRIAIRAGTIYGVCEGYYFWRMPVR